MRKIAFSLLAVAFVLSITSKFLAHTQSTPAASSHLPSGTATDISNSEIEAMVRKVAAARVSDQAIRVISINNEYNVGVSVVSRLKTSGKEVPSGIEHSQITEIYHVISGSGTLVTGGTLNDPKEVPPTDEVTTLLNGPSTEGSGIQEWREPENRTRRRGGDSAEHATLVQRNSHGQDCLLGRACRPAQGLTGRLHAQVQHAQVERQCST